MDLATKHFPAKENARLAAIHREKSTAFDMSEKIVILDFGSQYTQVDGAARARSAMSIRSLCPSTIPATELVYGFKLRSGIILSGGPSSVYAKDAPLPDKNIFALGVPMLGVCYGVQVFAHFLGGKVEKGLKREYGKGTASP